MTMFCREPDIPSAVLELSIVLQPSCFHSLSPGNMKTAWVACLDFSNAVTEPSTAQKRGDELNAHSMLCLYPQMPLFKTILRLHSLMDGRTYCCDIHKNAVYEELALKEVTLFYHNIFESLV